MDKPKTHQTDVVICGSGSAGLMSALWLAKYKIPFRILERRNGPLVTGQADGVQCRTVEIFESLGLSDPMLRESYHAMELAFWSADDGSGNDGGINRSHFAPDTEPGLSHLPHVILNQARVNELLTEEMLRCGGPAVDYGYEICQVDVDAGKAEDEDAYPVTVTTMKDGVQEVFIAKYALGCDGAHSAVRKSLGFQMVGDSTDSIWGVTDIYPRTNFPDIRKKAILHSPAGSIVVIPREGDQLVRLYTEMPVLSSGSATAASQITKEDIHQRAKLIFQPYNLEIAATKWWSAYSIGQRLADHFHAHHRVFLTGDACHTHSPKAGQGMNVSLQDGYNIGWKLGAYLSGQAASVELVKTYVSERQQTAVELIEFDRGWTKVFKTEGNKKDAGYVRDQFVKAGRYMAGQAYRYGRSLIVRPPEQEDAEDHSGLVVVGMRMPSAQVVRYSDARVLQLLSLMQSDCRWRVVVFDGDIQQKEVSDRLQKVGDSITAMIRERTPDGQDVDGLIEAFLVLKTKRTEVELEQIPEAFKPVTGQYKLQSLHKVLVDDESYNSGHGHAFETLGMAADKTTVVVVRPDQYISLIVSHEQVDKVGSFFKEVLK